MSHVRKQVLKDEIASCKQDGQSVMEYCRRLTKLWKELESYKTSRACQCEAAPDIEKEREDDQVHQFLFGLDLPRFANIRSTIADEYPLPSYNQVYSRVIREEQNLNTARTKEIETTPHVVAVSGSRFRDKSSLSCTHCHRLGHEVNECFLDRYYKQSRRAKSIQSDNRDTSNRANVEYRPVQRGGGTSRGRGRANNARPTSTSDNDKDQIAHLGRASNAPATLIPDNYNDHHDTSNRVNVNVEYKPVQRGGCPTRGTSRGRGRSNNARVMWIPRATSTLDNDKDQVPHLGRGNNARATSDS